MLFNRRISLRIGRRLEGYENSSIEVELTADIPNDFPIKEAFTRMRSELEEEIDETKFVKIFG